jgi:hypothetical protein
MKTPVIFCTITLLLAAIAASAEQPVTMSSLLKEMVDVESNARWPQPEFTCRQASSYDREKSAPDKPGWFANHDNTQYIRTEDNAGRKEQVMMDVDGPGAIVRFWLTAGGEKAGWLRVYLDGNAIPALTFPAFDLLHGDLKIGAPLAQPHPGYKPDFGGNTLFLPIPYARHCKVTWEEKAKSARYYQINYRTYAPGTVVQSFSLAQVEDSRVLINVVNQALEFPSRLATGKVSSLNETLAAGAESSLDLPSGPGAVRVLELRLETRELKEMERTLRSIIVQMAFDDKVTVCCPATDFFGSGVGINELRSWYRNVNLDDTMRCRWVMPYARKARVTLLNVGNRPVKATLHATTSSWKWDDRSMHFHAAWHYEAGLKTPPPSDWNFININGRGMYVGDSLALYNPVATWYGEGDEKIWVDGDSFPSHMGTGTEDYYGYSYAPKPVFHTPFNNLVRMDESMTQGWNVMSRTRHLDGIPFHRSLRFDMELISWKPTTLIYSATTYWYAFPGAVSNVKPQAHAAALPVPTLAVAQAAARAAIPRRPGAIECEKMKMVSKSAGFSAAPQDMEPWGREHWSGGEQLTIKAEKAGDYIELELPAHDDKPRQIVLYATQAPDYGTLGFSINGQSSTAAFDGYADKVRSAEPVKLGIFSPRDKRFLVRTEVTGTHPKSTGPRYYFGLDCIVLEPVP